MNVLRLAWSSYQDDESLKMEQRYLKNLGHRYRRIEPNGPIPDKLSSYDVLLINSQFKVDESFLKLWEQGLILTASNGFNHIDLDFASSLGIDVARTPQARADAVVEHTFAFVDALLRDFHRSGSRVGEGQWHRAKAHENITVSDNINFGILGFGVIGRKIADHALDRNFHNVMVYDPLKTPNRSAKKAIKFPAWGQFLDTVDLMTLHANLNSTTRGLVDRTFLEQLGSSGYLVNTARGEMVILEDLLDILMENELGGAALDVFPQEPPSTNFNSTVDGLLTTPHSAGFYPELLTDLREEIGSAIDAYEAGDQPDHTLKPHGDQELRQLEIPPDA